MHRLRFLSGSIVVLLAATFALAQTGSIQGTVTDSAGAVVQGAEITIRNIGSNAVRTATSSGTGAYSVPSLPPGVYEITTKMASFKAFHVNDLQLTVAQILTVNVQLEPGAVAEEVEVRADQISAIDFETSQVSNLVDQRSITDLPSDYPKSLRTGLAVSGDVTDQCVGRDYRERFARAEQQLPSGWRGQ